MRDKSYIELGSKKPRSLNVTSFAAVPADIIIVLVVVNESIILLENESYGCQ